MFPQDERSSLVVLSWLFSLLMGNNGGDSSNNTVSGVTQTVVSSNNTGSNNTSSDDTSSNDRGVVDDVVGGVGGGPGVHSNLGDVMNLMVNLVSDQTGLGNQVGLHSLVDGGSGDSSHGRDVVDNRGNNWGHSSDRGSVGNSNRGSMGDSHRGSVGNSGDRSSVGNSGDRGSGNSSNRGSMSHSSHTVTSVTQTMSNETNTVSGVTKTMSKETVSKDRGIGLSGRSSHGGAQDGGKDNIGVHLAVR